MKLLMLSGDRQTATGEQGPFWHMQREFSRWFERIDVLSPKPDGQVVLDRVFDRVHLHPAKVGRAGMLGYLKRRGAELLAEHGHDLIVSHDYGWFYNGLAAAALTRKSGVPYLSEIHHVPGFPVAADRREKLDRRIARTYVRWARNKAKAFRVVNRGQMPALLESWGVASEQIVVLPSLYMDLELFKPAPDVPPERDLLFVGRLVNNKGLDRIVAALDQLRQQGQPLRLTLLGRGPFKAEVQADVARRGLQESVEFLEWVDTGEDLAKLYRSSRAVICASTCEGGPRFTVEAMACGVPVVSTPVGVMPDLLEQGGGLLCDFTTEGLARTIAELLGDEARRAERGREARRLAEDYEYAAILGGYARGLHDLVGLTPERRPPASDAQLPEGVQ